MRISGWLAGIVAFGTLIIATMVCSFATYSWTRQEVIDLQRDSNILLESPLRVAQLAIGSVSIDDLLPTETPMAESNGGSTTVVIPSQTPVSMVVIPVEETPIPTTQFETQDTTTQPTPVPTAQPTLDPAAGLPVVEDPRQLRVLLMGIDQRSATGDQGPFRTDTMILLNIDPVRKTVGVISFPRDLWVRIPNFNTNERINAANRIGDLNAYPGGAGPALAMETVAQNFGIRVDKYVLINFDVFTTVVDTIAPTGIEVCVNEFIDDPDYPDAGYGTIRVTFEPGCEFMGAERLLQYARTRATQGGDFDRAARQQQVLDASLAHITSLGGITTFVSQVPTLWDQLTGNFRTNLTIDEIIAYGRLMSEIDRDDIHYAVIDNNYVDLGTGPQGEQILVPQQARINDLIQRVFFPQNEVDVADMKTRAAVEGASIYVYNGTSIQGLAADTREWLTGRGVSVSGVGNMPATTYTETYIRDYGGPHTWTARYMANLLGVPLERIQPGTDGLVPSGVVIVAGPDVQPLLTGGN